MSHLGKLIGTVLYLCALTIALTIFRGYVFLEVWNWFVVPLKVVSTSLTLAHATGLTFLVGVLMNPTPFPKEEDKEKTFETAMKRATEHVLPVMFKLGVLWSLAKGAHYFM